MNTVLPTIKIIFAGGGTGGHLYPAIAIADRIVELVKGRSTVNILFVGTKRGIEYRLRDRLGYPLRLINIRGLARSFTLKNLLVPFILVGALIRAGSLVKTFAPDLVVGTGGYVSWPVLKKASGLNIPTVLQEQNSYPGLTTRQLAPKARRVYLGFDEAREFIKTDGKIIVTGNPVRSVIHRGDRMAALKEYGLDSGKKTILILGGSQGARAINKAVIKSMARGSLPKNYQLLWQTGRRDYKDVSSQVSSKDCSCALFPFAENMADLYAASDMVIARAGALTLAELAACALPSLLLPLPSAAGDHQRKNAREFQRNGASIVIDDHDLESIDLLAEISGVMESEKFPSMKIAVGEMTAKARSAVDVIAQDIIDLINQTKSGERIDL